MTDLSAALVDPGHRRGSSPRVGHSIDPLAGRRYEEDHAVAVPGSPASGRRLTKRLGGAAGDGDLLQLPSGEKAEKAAVGRPERPVRSLGPDERSGFERIERTKPELTRSLRW